MTEPVIPRRTYSIYILASHSRCLYTGVTGDLLRRIWEHRTRAVPGYTARYAITRLVYYEFGDNVAAVISREKQIKSWTRSRRIALIERTNADWRDLAEPWFAGAWQRRNRSHAVPRALGDDGRGIQ